MANVNKLKQEIAQLEKSISNPNTAESTKKILRATLTKMKDKLSTFEKYSEPKTKPPAIKKETVKKTVKKTIVSKPKLSEEDKLRKEIEQMKATVNSPKTSAKTKDALNAAIVKAEEHLHNLVGPKKVKGVPSTKINLKKQGKTVFDKYSNSGIDIPRDAERKARPFGKRKSADGNTYYEYRANRADVNPKKFPRLEDGGAIEEYIPKMGSVTVKFKDPEHNYTTSVSPLATEESVRRYFVGKKFDVGVYPHEDMQEVIDIDFEKGHYEDGGEVTDDQLFAHLQFNEISKEDFDNLTEERKAELKQQIFGNKKEDILEEEEEFEEDQPSDEELIEHLIRDKGYSEEEAVEYLSDPDTKSLLSIAYLADTEHSIDEDAALEMIPDSEAAIIFNQVPKHFDSGHNIDVFGYTTKHFDVCGKAVLDFERVISEIQSEEESPAKYKMMEHTKYASMWADAIFGAEKEAVENNSVLKFVFDKTIDNVQMLGIHAYLTTKKLKTSWVGLHLYEMALRIHPENIVANVDPIAQELSDGEKFEKGGDVSDDYKHDYMMLSRLQSDCEYFLGYGHRSENVLPSKSIDNHIDNMKRIYNRLPEKPEWLSMEDILDY